jgi:hypothetical protein
MTSRERELAAIRHEVPDRIPVDRICIETLEPLAAHLGVAPANAIALYRAATAFRRPGYTL